MATERDPVPVPPDAVRVWRGYRNPGIEEGEFFEKLGSIFIPGTVLIQAPVGLTAYLPSVMPAEKPAGTPDEIAVVFYAYQDAYHEAKKTVGGRAYSDMHALVFDLSISTSGFPIKFAGEVTPEMRYFLFDEHVDWQFGTVNAYVGIANGLDPASFNAAVADFLSTVQSTGGPDGAIAVASTDHLVYWEHWSGECDSQIHLIADQLQTVYHQAMPAQPMFEGLWQDYDGVTVAGGESFNCQFDRRS